MKAGSAPARGQPSPLGPGREPGQRPRALRGRGAGGGSSRDKAAHARVGGRRHTGGWPPAAAAGYLRGECRCAGRAPPLTSAHGGGEHTGTRTRVEVGVCGTGRGGVVVVRLSGEAGMSAMRWRWAVVPERSSERRVFAPLFLSPCLRSAPSALPALLRSASCFSFSSKRCASSPERVIFIGLELIFVGGCRLFF